MNNKYYDVCFFVKPLITEGTDVVVNSMADDVLGSNYELTGALNDWVESWDWLYL